MLNYFKKNEILLILCIDEVFMMMGMGVVSPILPQYARSFDVSITMVGLLITGFGVARIVMDIPTGRLAGRFGRRPLLIIGPILLATGAIACGLAQNYWQLLVFRLIQGMGSGMFTTAATVMLADISAPVNRARVMSMYQGSLLIGAGVGPVVGGFAAEYFGLRAPFFVVAFFELLATVWGYFRLRETRPVYGSGAEAQTGGARHSLFASRTGLAPLFRDPNFMLVSMVTFGIFFTRTGTQQQLLPLLGNDRLGLNAGQIGLALTVIPVLDFIALFISGRLSDRFGRKIVIVPGVIIAAISLLILSQANSYAFLLLASAVWGAGVGVAGATPSAYVADIVPRENHSSGMALFRAISDVGMVIGPLLLGSLADTRGYTFALFFNSGLIFLIIIVFQALAKEPRHLTRPAALPKLETPKLS